MTSVSTNFESKVHNKSQQVNLSVATATEVEFSMWSKAFDKIAKKQVLTGLGAVMRCQVLDTKDGRVTVNQKKVAYGYQIVARKKFGFLRMSTIKASKQAQDMVISHICGTRNCVIASHLVLEPKVDNDSRTHCHYCLTNICLSAGQAKVQIDAALNIGLCAHNPRCLDVGATGPDQFHQEDRVLNKKQKIDSNKEQPSRLLLI